MKYLPAAIFILFQSALFLTSCSRTGKAPESGSGVISGDAGKEGTVAIRRYEKALFSIKADQFDRGLAAIAPEFRVFMGDHYNRPEAMEQLELFVNDPLNREVYTECLTRFPDMKQYETGFYDAFTRMKEEIPGITLPQVYTYISGFDFEYPIKYNDTALIIALDMYMGADYKEYSRMGIPLYITSRLTPDHILPDCMKEMSLPLITSKKSPVLLDAMINEGKRLYFTDVMLPDVADHFKIGFTEAQVAWCEENEKNLWEFLIGNELLYSAEAQPMSMFMTDGPFTSSFSQDSPARTGAWLGWQIVRSFMKNNNMRLTELLAESDAQKILGNSGYKPRK